MLHPKYSRNKFSFNVNNILRRGLAWYYSRRLNEKKHKHKQVLETYVIVSQCKSKYPSVNMICYKIS